MRIPDVKPVSFTFQLRCDRCGAEAQHNVDAGFNNLLQIELDASWGSAIGDGTHAEVDLCHGCLKETLGRWLRLTPSAWNRFPVTADLDVPEDQEVQERRALDDTKRQRPSQPRSRSSMSCKDRTWVVAHLSVGDWFKPFRDTKERWRIEFAQPSGDDAEVVPFFLDEQRGESGPIPDVPPGLYRSTSLVQYIVRTYCLLRDISLDAPIDREYAWSSAALAIEVVGHAPFGEEHFRIEVDRLEGELRISSRFEAGDVATHSRPENPADLDPLALVLREALLADAGHAAADR